MYHDQGHIPVKPPGLREVVAVTLGLPFLLSPCTPRARPLMIAPYSVQPLGSMTAAIRAPAAAGDHQP